ncbi:MAG: hypothetical protein U9N49_07505 [Campylobacterota bacterium]|nr:hypothetical protein [Campylobacterota bacterium]
MTHNIKKQYIFDFFKGKSFIQDFNDETLVIEETKNEEKVKDPLRFLTIGMFNKDSQYWIVDTESKAFQLQGNKVEKVILEQTSNGVLNIVMVEMKSKKIDDNKVINKFKKSLEFIYILLHLLEGKANQSINVFGILVAQKDMQWNYQHNLKIFNATSIRYSKRSFFTEEAQIELDYQDIVAKV